MLSSALGNEVGSKVVAGCVVRGACAGPALVGDGGPWVAENTVIDDSGPDALGCEATRLALEGRPPGLGYVVVHFTFSRTQRLQASAFRSRGKQRNFWMRHLSHADRFEVGKAAKKPCELAIWDE